MKVIDLINMKYNKEEMPKHIVINRMHYIYDNDINTYRDENMDRQTIDFTDNVLNMPVEVIEDEEIDIDRAIIIEKDSSNQEFIRYKNNGATGSGYSCDYSTIDLIFAKALKQLNKKIKEKE